MFLSDPDLRGSVDPLALSTDLDPGGQLITNPAGTIFYLVVFMAIQKKSLQNSKS
jgi:hypothetical protein